MKDNGFEETLMKYCFTCSMTRVIMKKAIIIQGRSTIIPVGAAELFSSK